MTLTDVMSLLKAVLLPSIILLEDDFLLFEAISNFVLLPSIILLEDDLPSQLLPLQ